MNDQKTVYIMMSGGVDSSVAALDLKEAGYNVIGVFMKCWSIDRLKELGVDEDLYGCFWEEDSRDARMVADTLDIPFYVWNFEEQYKDAVVDYMISEYQSGRTPNPDIMCNSMIKFGIFFDRARSLGADYVATGHYAKMRLYKSQKGQESLPIIERGGDMNKDQSYFLSRVSPQKLQHVLFPIGEYTNKADVRSRAEQYHLVTAAKKDSQGLCFIGETPLRELLLQTIGEKEGDIVDLNGSKLGSHPGAALYTIGQRNKLGLAGGPWFVARIDIKTNTVVVAHDSQQSELFSKIVKCDKINIFIPVEEIASLGDSNKLTGQIRYRQEAKPLKIVKMEENKFEVIFESDMKAVSAGQSLVIYSHNQMVASGIIQ